MTGKGLQDSGKCLVVYLYTYADVVYCMGKYVCICVLDERFHVISTVTVKTSAIHVSPKKSMREASSAKR